MEVLTGWVTPPLCPSPLDLKKVKKYKTIYFDAPWAYRNVKTGGSLTSGSKSKYPTLTPKEVTQLNVPRLFDNNGCIVFMWTTVPLLPETLPIFNAWGVTYKTSLFWVKTGKLGMGFWFRGNVEILLMGIYGKVKPFRSSTKNIIEAHITGHSKKPDIFYDLIESVSPSPRVELFATKARPGWDSVGFNLGSDVFEFLDKA